MLIQLKIMSFNSRCVVEADGINCFWNRTERILPMIREEDPDVIGFQEITPAMQEWYVEHLTEYTVVGVGRGKRYNDESTAIAFKKRTLRLISADTVMLSSTPRVFGSHYEGSDQSACPRCYTKVFLKHAKIDTPFWIYNVHTDHQGALARQMASVQLLQDLSSHDDLFVMTGDFNAMPDRSEIRMLLSSPHRRVIDTTAAIEGTFHNFGRFPRLEKIDYIFADPRMQVESSRAVSDEGVEGVYLSDHLPVVTVFSMGNE